jgi:hypothetical protein
MQARLPWRWSLESFPFDRQPGISKAQIQTLAGLDFLRRADNVLLIDPAPVKPASGSDCCVKLASMATVAASTMLKSCSTNFTPRWRIARPPGCWAS